MSIIFLRQLQKSGLLCQPLRNFVYSYTCYTYYGGRVHFGTIQMPDDFIHQRDKPYPLISKVYYR